MVKQIKSKIGYSKYFPILNVLLDLFCVNVAFFLSHFIRYQHFNWWPNTLELEFLSLVNVVWVLVVFNSKLTEFIRVDSLETILRKFTGAYFIYAGTIYLFLFMLNLDRISRLWVFYHIFSFYVLVIVVRFFFMVLIAKYRKKGGNYRQVVIVGTDSISMQFYRYIQSDLSLGYRVLGFFDFGQGGQQLKSENPVRYLGDRKYIVPFLMENQVHEVYWKLTSEDDEYVKEVIEYCENNLIRIRFIPYFGAPLFGRIPTIDMYNLIPVVTLRNEPLQDTKNQMIKRLFDVVFSLVVMAVLIPLVFPWVILAIKINSPGPVFFKQQRTGENGHSFWCYKFRTMQVNEDSDQLQATKNDVRITAVGRFLRKSNLDELPQFFNVLLGDMSVVGPRPHMLKHTEEYSKQVSKFLVRHFAKPGITGWAQVNGLRGETKEVEDMEKRVKADIWYVENWSILLDIRIVLKTVFNMFRGDKNAY